MSQQINLFNPIFLQQKKLFSARTMGVALAVLVLGVIALTLYGSRRVALLEQEAHSGALQLQQKQAQLTSVLAEFPLRQKSLSIEAELVEAERQLTALRQIAGVLERGELGNTHGYTEYFRAFARQRVDGVWLTGLGIHGAGLDLGVRGRALRAQQVPLYLNRLTQEATLRGKGFSGLRIVQPEPIAGTDSLGKAVSVAAPYVEFSLQARPDGSRP